MLTVSTLYSSYTINSIPVNVYSHNDYSLNTTEVRITVHPSIPSVHQDISSVHQDISSVHQDISSVHQHTPSVLSYPLFNHSWIDKKM